MKKQSKRYYKEITYTTFDFISDSPVELIDMTSVYDIESFEYYILLTMRNLSGRRVKSVDVKISLFTYSNVPYTKIFHTYNLSPKHKGDIIGEKEYIPLPQSYYKDIEIMLLSVTYEDGEVEELGLSSKKSPDLISHKSVALQAACEIADRNVGVKRGYPPIVVPAINQFGWICTCSYKNPLGEKNCLRCNRDRDVLMSLYTEDSLKQISESTAKEALTLAERAEKSRFLEKRERKKYDSAKENEIEVQIKKVEAREKYKDKMRIQALPRFVLYFVGAYLLYLLIRLVTGV